VADLADSGSDDQQQAEHAHRDQDDHRSGGAQQRPERRSDTGPDRTAGSVQRCIGIAREVEQTDRRPADEHDAEAEAQPLRRCVLVAALGQEEHSTDDEGDRHEYLARAEQRRGPRVESVAEGAGEVGEDPEQGQDADDEQRDRERVAAMVGQLLGELVAPR
jgi:hypothetical protein